ncbi:Eukaryotic translation initiation factor 5B [Linum grandiflorum]
MSPMTISVSEPPEEKVDLQPEPVSDQVHEDSEDDEKKESAAAKKKRKKKEREKAKKAAAAAAEVITEGGKAEEAEKKVPKHVREILAKLQEVEAKKALEEEEKQKEEDESLRLKEMERRAEEAKRKKKEKEKEKKLKKKQEGTYLTPKQKLEQRKAEAFLKNKVVIVDKEATKRPIYENKRRKPAKKTEEKELVEEQTDHQDIVETDQAVEEEIEETREIADDIDDEWDSKSWEDVGINVEEEEEEEEARDLAPVDAEEKVVQDVQIGMEESVGGEEKSLRSPICCIMGHVDAGKTKLLDCIRGTNVQQGEAGGITQQIGATYFPAENIRERTREDAKLEVPGLLVIDTPGHESFTNLRSRGSGLCDIAVLVVDIMHGLEPQTVESLNLLKMRNTEFIVALNKVDRLYGWKACKNQPIVKAMKQQTNDVQVQFNNRIKEIIGQFQEQGLNTALYYKNKEMGETYSIVPTSAISGEGIPDLLLLLVQWTQKTMVEKLTFSNEIQCTVLEVKVVEGHGTTIDVILVNGVLHEGDQIVVCGSQGPIVTTIRALLTPHPMKELRVKGTYLHHKEIKAAQGIKIAAQGLENAIVGTGLHVVGPDDDLEDVKESAMEDKKSVMSRLDRSSSEGVHVQASTLGSVEALLDFLKSEKIPVSGTGIGPVHKNAVTKASTMLEKTKSKEYAAILAFDVKVTPEIRKLADELGVKIFTADIIYHLADQFKAYIHDLKEAKKKELAAAGGDEIAVFPCGLKIIRVFNTKDPIVLGVEVVEGIAKVGTPICIPTKEFIDIGRIASIESNHKPIDTAKKGQQVSIKIIGSNAEGQQKMFGRHFEMDDKLVSRISRTSIDLLKAYYRDDLTTEEWGLVAKLKDVFGIRDKYRTN